MAVRYFFALEGWRGIAACMILLLHLTDLMRVQTHIADINIVSNSFLFVDFFFVLSGFILTYQYAEKIIDKYNKGMSFVVYFLRRVGRLYPLHLTIIIISIFLETLRYVFDGTVGEVTGDAFPEGKGGFEVLLEFLLLEGITQGLTEHDSLWNPPAWSVSVEFYLNIILFFIFIVKNNKYIFALSLFFGLFALYFFPETQHTNVLRGVTCLAAGVLTYYLFRYTEKKFQFNYNLNSLVAFSVLEILSIATMVKFLDSQVHNVYLHSPFVFSLVVLIFAYQNGIIGRMLNFRFFRTLGTLSYSIYLIHWNMLLTIYAGLFVLDRKMGAIDLFNKNGDMDLTLFQGDLVILILFVGVIGVSFLSYHIIEAPARHWFKKISQKF